VPGEVEEGEHVERVLGLPAERFVGASLSSASPVLAADDHGRILRRPDNRDCAAMRYR
jgi:hypothetical protein